MCTKFDVQLTVGPGNVALPIKFRVGAVSEEGLEKGGVGKGGTQITRNDNQAARLQAAKFRLKVLLP